MPTLKPVHKVPDGFYDYDDADQNCPACQSPEFQKLYRSCHFGIEIEFYQCSCGLIKQIPIPNKAFFEWFFNSDLFISSKRANSDEIWGFYDYLRDEPSRLRTSQYRYKRISKLLDWSSPQRIMKIGPSTGTFLYIAKKDGHEVRGCDISNQFVEYARSHYGVTIDHGRFERMNYPPESFDAILLLNVIENVPNVDELIQEISNAIKPGGHIILNHVEMVYNIIAVAQKERYFLYRPPVCYMFSSRALSLLLERFGFTVKHTVRDVRFLHIEKIATLLRWQWLLKASEAIGISRTHFPIWAYPSWITVAQKLGD